MFRTFFSNECPKCEQRNYIEESGNLWSGHDKEALKCWNCGEIFWLDDSEDFLSTMRDIYSENLAAGMTLEEVLKEEAVVDDGMSLMQMHK